MTRRYGDDTDNPFAGNDLAEQDGAIYDGKPPLPGGLKSVVAKPMYLMTLWPDPRQPRRVLPGALRAGFSGNPADIPHVLGLWQQRVDRHLREGERLNARRVLLGQDMMDVSLEDADPVVRQYAELIDLAQSIHRDGLINPITVYERDGRTWVLTGERRLWAHFLLLVHVDKQYEKVAARVVEYSVRQQVQENTARRDLNAVGLARCYALVCMEIAEREKGQRFEPYEAMLIDTAHGISDRAYYAQVDGTPYGFGGEVLAALNLTNRSMLSHYQTIFDMPDEAWVRADAEDWSIRECVAVVKPPKPAPPPSAPNVEHVQHFDAPPAPPPETSRESAWDRFEAETPSNVNRDLHSDRPAPPRQEPAGGFDWDDPLPEKVRSTSLVENDAAARAMLEFIADWARDSGIRATAEKLLRHSDADLRREISGSPNALHILGREMETWSDRAWVEVIEAQWRAMVEHISQFYKRACDMHDDIYNDD